MSARLDTCSACRHWGRREEMVEIMNKKFCESLGLTVLYSDYSMNESAGNHASCHGCKSAE
jgi:hypothetical protein